jgi:DNA-binding MarR family transcriptional regulator
MTVSATQEKAAAKPSRAKRAKSSHDDPLVVADLQTTIGYKLRRAQLLVFQDFIESFNRLKLRPAEFSVLSLIAAQPGQKQTEIAEKLGIKRANFVALMDGLEARGLAERRKAIGDKRSHSLHLTEEGTTFVRKMTQVWRAHEQRLVERLGGEKERDQLITLLDRILTCDEPG